MHPSVRTEVTDERLILDRHPRLHRSRGLWAHRQREFEDTEQFDLVSPRGDAIKRGRRPGPGAHVAAAPARLRRILGHPVQQAGDRGCVPHLDRALELRGEVVTK